MSFRLTCFVIAALLSGCASFHDQEISKIEASKKSLLLEHGRTYYFSNVASYRTQEGVYEGKEELSHILGEYTSGNIFLVKITAASRDEFTIEFINESSKVIQVRRFILGESFDIEGGGNIKIQSKSTCGSHDSPGVGCQWSSVKLFEDKDGNLVAIQSSGGAGLVGIVPVSVGADYVSVFAPIKNVSIDTP